ncbi:uncharacterized protein K452DRAFT_324924 [Aplosporella prunicola CBS 121167]|uniref:Coupling of ubiquitin conjugation to ER degradation protein 1 n=1 Tax=Aplosporella prunicola CBS 121167 TaxID=1176127 RepID=A0A6A6BNF1_9PEZI|nr:uncharacterized protein K452DRAFT_324924 [Aplosporella prunicola CBS 121167]KAF2145198.1 hypothetical protein K452DRAFT_324924 [Aplosporella prunicola CBS 121167]
MSDGSSTLNIPQLLVLAVVSFLVFRWYNSSSSSPARASASRNAGPRVNPAAVEQIVQMFPQLDRRHIAWDLQRNGSNVAGTTERILSGRGLEVPPPSFQPQLPQISPRPTTTNSTPAKPTHPDLITRYNLSSKINSSSTETPQTGGDATQKTTWSQNKNERQQILQRRREEMILAARRKMEEKDKAKAASTS